jgi:uncharacterized membrane protein
MYRLHLSQMFATGAILFTVLGVLTTLISWILWVWNVIGGDVVSQLIGTGLWLFGVAAASAGAMYFLDEIGL